MNMLATTGARHSFVRQAESCRSSGSDFVAAVLEAVDRQLALAPMSSRMVQDWTGDPAAAAVALRVNGALHALARRGSPPYLADLYRGEHDDFDGAIAEALLREDQFIADWIRDPTQTNEVARGAVVVRPRVTSAS